MATALLVLDMLDDFITGKLANPAAEQVIEPIGALAGVARSRGDWVVVYGSDAHRAGDLELAVFGEHAMADSSGARYRGLDAAGREHYRTQALLFRCLPRRTSTPPAGCIASTGSWWPASTPTAAAVTPAMTPLPGVSSWPWSPTPPP